uniref:ABM domain-containing protein n=1 Tax=Alexandrium monilatum TaxID=311494 RepID=A0A7S4V382_9DINO
MARLFSKIGSIGEWYADLSVGEKGVVMMSLGMMGGTAYGTYERRIKFKVPESDYLVATGYRVPEAKKKEFEAAWSDSARLAQRQPGYEWTRTYKALDWEDSPFHYISFRMWNEEHSFKRFSTYDATLKELLRRLGETYTTADSSVYRIIVDDSVRRIIE